MNKRKEELNIPLRFIRALLVGLVVGALTVLLALLILSAIATTYDLPSAAVVPLATICNALGAFTGGFACAKSNKRTGWLLGIVAAFALFVFSTAAGFNFFTESDGSFFMIKALIMTACGMVGGILAVNTGKRRKKR